MIGYVLAGIAIVAGAILTVYCVSTATDQYWNPGTRMMGIVGAGFGLVVVAIGFWGFTL